LGLDPGMELRRLETAILKDEPSLSLTTESSPESGQSPNVERLPPLPQQAHGRRRAPLAAALAAALAVVLVASTAIVWGRLPVWTSRQAQPSDRAASECKMQAHVVTDYRNRPFDRVYHCTTFAGTNLYANPQDRAPLQDVTFMNASHDNWVVCQMRGRPNPVIQERTSSWWLYTQGDTDNRPNDYGYTHAWAFMPATVVVQASRDRPVPVRWWPWFTLRPPRRPRPVPAAGSRAVDLRAVDPAVR